MSYEADGLIARYLSNVVEVAGFQISQYLENQEKLPGGGASESSFPVPFQSGVLADRSLNYPERVVNLQFVCS